MHPINALNPKLLAQIVQKGKKGFSEDHPKPVDTPASQAAAAEYAHKRSQFVLNEQKSSWPSIETMRKSRRTDWTIPAVKSRIAELKIEHRQQLAKAIKYQANEEHQMEVDSVLSFDEDANWSPDLTETLKGLHRMERRLEMHQSDDFISRLRYTHIITLKPLYERLHKLVLVEESAKGQRARLFPKSSQAWREIDTRDAKLKVAKFLLLDKKKQDEMVEREVIWRGSRADVDRVVLEFKSNVMFSQEVGNFVRENQSTDPRRRAT